MNRQGRGIGGATTAMGVKPKVVVLAVVTAAIIGAMAGRAAMATKHTSSTVSMPNDGAPAAGPRATEASVPVGYTRTREGAAAAATTFLTVASERLLLLDSAAREAAVQRMIAPAVADRARAQLVGDSGVVDRLRQAASRSGAPKAFLRNLPVAYRIEAYSADRARVSVWANAIWVLDGVGGPGQAWTTTTVELAWSDGDWRLWALSSRDGPTPATTTGPITPAADLLGALDTFASYRYDPV